MLGGSCHWPRCRCFPAGSKSCLGSWILSACGDEKIASAGLGMRFVTKLMTKGAKLRATERCTCEGVEHELGHQRHVACCSEVMLKITFRTWKQRHMSFKKGPQEQVQFAHAKQVFRNFACGHDLFSWDVTLRRLRIS